MIVHLKVNNFEGIKDQIRLSSIASNKVKHIPGSTSKINEKTKILKKLCIIGSNGSGKTSILNAISTIQDFIIFPFRKNFQNNENFEAFIKNMNEDELKQFIINNNTLRLGESNNLNTESPTSIEVEIYIPKRKHNIPGLYQYKIIYDKNYKEKGIICEELQYKEDINSNKYKVLFSINNIIESEISTSILYENNINIKKLKSSNNEQNINYYKSFFDEIMKYTSILDGTESADLINVYNYNPELFKLLCKISDPKIIDVTINENLKQPELQFWNSEKTFLKFSQLSNGTCKMLVIGCILIESINTNSLTLIDEIEISLHPKLAKFLSDLNTCSQKNNFSQIIFTTHSPYIAFSATNDQLYYISNFNGNIKLSNISEAINKGIITKDKKPENAWAEDLLINNPDEKLINNFFKKI